MDSKEKQQRNAPLVMDDYIIVRKLKDAAGTPFGEPMVTSTESYDSRELPTAGSNTSVKPDLHGLAGVSAAWKQTAMARERESASLVNADRGNTGAGSMDASEAKVEQKQMNIMARMGGKGSGGAIPRQITLTDTVRCTRRFYANAGISSITLITVGNVLSAIGGIATSATNHAAWATAFRLRRIDVWSNVSTTSASTLPTIQWATNSDYHIKPRVVNRSIPAGVSVSGVLRMKPPAKSLASFWQDYSSPSTQIFALNQVGIGTVIDVSVEYTMADSITSSTAYQSTFSTMTAGKVYFPKLDGAGGVLYPVDYVTVP